MKTNRVAGLEIYVKSTKEALSSQLSALRCRWSSERRQSQAFYSNTLELIAESSELYYRFRCRIFTSKLTTPFWSRSATIETFRVMLYSTWIICCDATDTFVL